MRKAVFQWCIVLLFALTACTAHIQSTSPSPTISFLQTTASKVPTEEAFVRTKLFSGPIETVFPTLTPTSAALSTAPAADVILIDSIHSLTRGIEGGADITLDDYYLYFVEDKDPGSLYRIPLNGGTPEKIAASKYAGGRINLIRPLLTKNWIIIVDIPYQGPNSQGIPGTWMIRAINLHDFSERLLARSGVGDPVNLAPTSNFSTDGDFLYWTISFPEKEDIISRMDLNTGQTVVLTRTNQVGSYWSLLGASDGRLVVEQDTEESHGGGSRIYLFDPPGEQAQPLSTDGVSHLRQFVYPWVVLQTGPQNQTPDEISLYDLNTSQTRSITLPGMDNSYPQMDGMRIYWSGATEDTYTYFAIYILDFSKNTVYVYPSSEQNVLFPEMAIHGGTIAWLRVTNVQTNQPVAYLEWATIK